MTPITTPTEPSRIAERTAQFNSRCASVLGKAFERWFKLSDTWLNQAATQQSDPRAQQHYFTARQCLHRHQHRLQIAWQQHINDDMQQFWQQALPEDALQAWQHHAWRDTLARMISATEARSPARLSQVQHGLNRLLQRRQTLAQLPFAPTRLVSGFATLLSSIELSDDVQIPILSRWEVALQAHQGDLLGEVQQFLEGEQNLTRTTLVVPTSATHKLRFSNLQALLSLRGTRPPPLGSRQAGYRPTETLQRTELLDFIDRFQAIQWDAHAGDPVLTTTLGMADFRFWLQQELNNQEAIQGPKQLSRADDDLCALSEQLIAGLNSSLLPQQVKSIVLRLQIVLLKALLLDQSFFTDAQHPARGYLNAIGRVALSWKPGHSLINDPLLSGLQQSVAQLLSGFQRDISSFERAERWIEQTLSGETQKRARLAQRALTTETGRIRLDRGQQFVDGLLAQRIDHRAMPAIGEILVEGPWRQVLLHVLLKQGPDSPSWAIALITTDQLIGSLQEPRLSDSLTTAERQAWISRLPGMVRRMCSELHAIQCSQKRIGKITLALWQYHSERFQLHAEDLRQIPHDDQPEPINEAWLRTTLAESQERFSIPATDPLNELSSGDWVALERGKNQYFAQVAGYIPDTSSYLFVDYAGSKNAHLTRQQMSSLKKQERFKAIKPSPWADEAIRSLMEWLEERPHSRTAQNAGTTSSAFVNGSD